MMSARTQTSAMRGLPPRGRSWRRARAQRNACVGVGEGEGAIVNVECVDERVEMKVGERGGAREACARRRVYCLVFVILEDTDGTGEEVKGVEHDKDTGANDARCSKGHASSPSLSSLAAP
jgi:hypothetical protein